MRANQVTSILLCVLIGSTLGHDYQRAKYFAPQSRSKQLSRQTRDAGSNQCVVKCTASNDNPDTPYSGLKVYINETINTIAIVNITAEVALFIDVDSNLVGLLNGTTGGAIVFNIETQNGVYIESSTDKHLWLSSRESIEVYLTEFTSLQAIIDLNIGVKFDVISTSKLILSVVANLIVHLSTNLKIKIEADAALGLALLIGIGKSVTTLLKGTLKGILQLAGAAVIHIRGDIEWLEQVLVGIALFVSKIKGGIGALIAAKIKLDLAILLGAAHGLELFINLLLAVAGKIKLSALAGILNSAEPLFALIVQLGGGVPHGVTGIFKVISELIAVIQGKVKIEVFLATLVQFSISKKEGRGIDIHIYIGALLQAIKVAKIEDNKELAGFIDIIVQLNDGKLTVNGVNVSAIIKTLAGAVTVGLELVVSILIAVSGVIGVAISIPALLLFLISQITSAAGKALLTGLGIAIKVEGNILAYIIKNTNITNIIKFFLGGSFNVVALINSIPILKDIYAALSAAVKSSSKGEIDIKILFQKQECSNIAASIKSFIKGVLHINGATIKTTETPTTVSGGGGGGGGGGGFLGGIFGNGGIFGGGGTTTGNGSGSDSGSNSSSGNGGTGGSSNGSISGGSGGSGSVLGGFSLGGSKTGLESLGSSGSAGSSGSGSVVSGSSGSSGSSGAGTGSSVSSGSGSGTISRGWHSGAGGSIGHSGSWSWHSKSHSGHHERKEHERHHHAKEHVQSQ